MARPSLLEQELHEQIGIELEGLYPSSDLSPACNILGIVTRHVDANASTHSFDFSFFVHHGVLEALPVRTSNLSKSSVSEYEEFDALSATFESSVAGFSSPSDQFRTSPFLL